MSTKMRRMLTQWQPLEDPTAFTASFRVWRRALKMAAPEEKLESQVQVYGSSTVVSASVVECVRSSIALARILIQCHREKPMTPYESLLWNTWLPRVRSSLNNDWSPEDPLPAVRLYEAWSSFLPQFIRDNFFDQLILPKVHKAVGDWSPRRSKVPLQTLVFPWLPHVGLRLEDVLGDARRKVKSVLRSWTTADAIPQDLGVWKDVRLVPGGLPVDCDINGYVVGFRRRGLGHDVTQIRCTQTWIPITRRLPRQPSTAGHAATARCNVLGAVASSEHPIAITRKGVFPEVA